MIAADNTKHHHMQIVVEPVKPLGALPSRQAGDDLELPDASGAAEAGAEVAALDELFVGLWVVELSHHGPHQRERRVYRLAHA